MTSFRSDVAGISRAPFLYFCDDYTEQLFECQLYISKKPYGFNVSSLYIAQVKDKCGLDKRLNYNLSKKDDQHVLECPKEKEDAIMDAFRHFGLIEG